MSHVKMAPITADTTATPIRILLLDQTGAALILRDAAIVPRLASESALFISPATVSIYCGESILIAARSDTSGHIEFSVAWSRRRTGIIWCLCSKAVLSYVLLLEFRESRTLTACAFLIASVIVREKC
jgi:hypothetical protein